MKEQLSSLLTFKKSNIVNEHTSNENNNGNNYNNVVMTENNQPIEPNELKYNLE